MIPAGPGLWSSTSIWLLPSVSVSAQPDLGQEQVARWWLSSTPFCKPLALWLHGMESLYFPLLLPQCLLCHLLCQLLFLPLPLIVGFPKVSPAYHTHVTHSWHTPLWVGAGTFWASTTCPGPLALTVLLPLGETHRPPVWVTFSCLELNCGLSQGCDVPGMGPDMEEALPSALGAWGAPNPICRGRPSSHEGAST